MRTFGWAILALTLLTTLAVKVIRVRLCRENCLCGRLCVLEVHHTGGHWCGSPDC